MINIDSIKHFLYTKKYYILIFLLILIVDMIITDNYNYFIRSVNNWGYRGTEARIKSLLLMINYTIQVSVIVLLLASENKILRNFAYLLVFLTFSIFLTYYFINGYGFTMTEATVALTELNFAKGAFTNFSSSIFKAILISFLLSGLIYTLIRKTRHKIKSIILVTLFSSLTFAYSTGKTQNVTDDLFLIPFQVPFNFYNAIRAPIYFGKKEDIAREVGQSKIDKIVYFVDESINGDKLSINGFKTKTTPFLKSVQKDILNYGIASSGTNCSSTSNTILRSGLMPDMIPDKEQLALKQPNIWAYAKKAGYYTLYIDAQDGSDKPGNLMNKYDLDTIDKFIKIDKNRNPTMFKNDYKVIDILKTELAKHKKIFVYVNKFGAHFPYEEMYPQNKKFFTPTLAMNEAPSQDIKNKVLNSYFNVLRWSVDLWWEEIYHKLKKLDVLFVYTSDHGQNIFDTPNQQTHCTNEADSKEANVPLFLIPFGKTRSTIVQYAKENISSNINNCSHFNIFPTILFLQGYSLNKNELSLFNDLSQQKRFFYTGDIFERTILKRIEFNKD